MRFHEIIQENKALSVESLLEYAIPPTTWGYWITDAGVALPVKTHDHSKTAMEHMGVLDDYYAEKYHYDEDQTFESGWVWVKCKDDYREGPDRLEVSFTRGKLTPRAASTLSRLARSDDFAAYSLHMHGEGAHRVEFATFSEFLRAVRSVSSAG